MNKSNEQMNMIAGKYLFGHPIAYVRVGLIGLLFLLCFTVKVQGQTAPAKDWALDVHHRVRQFYINKDSTSLQLLTDSVCAARPATVVQKGACEECRGFQYLLEKRYEPAAEAYERSAAHFAEEQYPYLQAQGLNNAGWAASQSYNNEKTMALYDQAEKVLHKHARKVEDSTLLCWVYSNQITIFEIQDNYPMAFSKSIKMLELAEQIPDTAAMVGALKTLMNVYGKFDEEEGTQKYKDQLCRIYETPGSYYNPIESMVYKMYFARTAQEANQYLQTAERYYAGLSQPESYRIAAVWYAYALIMRDLGKNETAAHYYQKTIDGNKDYFEFTSFPTMWSYINLVKIAVQQKKYQEAITMGQETLGRAQSMKDLEMQKQLHTALSTAFYHIGRTDSAYVHLARATMLRDSIEKENNDKSFMRIHMSQLFEKEKEILTLQQAQERQVAEARIFRQRVLLGITGIGLLLLCGLAFAFYRNFRLKKQAADALAVANAELAAGQEKLRRSNAKLRRFSDIVSHDILSNLDLLLSTGNLLVGRQPQGEKLLQYYDMTQDTSRRLKYYCLNLLDEARRNTGREGMELTDPMPAVHAILARLAPALRKADLQVELHELSPAPLPAVLVEQLFQNLITNALQYAASGPGPLLSIAEEVDVRGRACWIVEDNGPGIPADRREAIFDKRTRPASDDGKGQGRAVAGTDGAPGGRRGHPGEGRQERRGAVCGAFAVRARRIIASRFDAALLPPYFVAQSLAELRL